MPVDQFDYSDAAIAFRALSRLAQSPDTRSQALDLIWLETRDRALQLYPRAVTALDPDAACDALAALEDAVALAKGFVSTRSTPSAPVGQALQVLLAAIGIELASSVQGENHPEVVRSQDSIWDYHLINADLRQSRHAGTGLGGRELSPLEDAIRRLTTMLIGTGFLDRMPGDTKLPAPGSDFGMAELRAIHNFVQAAVAVDRSANDRDVGS